MQTKPFILQTTNWKTIKEITFDVAILPWGATEPHNFHLPYGTDTIQAEHIAKISAEKAWNDGAKVIVLPVIPFGVNVTQLGLNMVINITPTAQLAILKDVVHSLQHHGIKKLLILNSHGGNEFKSIIRELKCIFPDFFIGSINWWQIPIDKKYFQESGEHAGALETANMLLFSPEHVLPREDWGNGQSGSFKLAGFKDGWAWAPRDWEKISKDTGIGNPSEAKVEKATMYIEELTGMLAQCFKELAETDIDSLYETI